ncbi:WXG100 family type VII secretion target [Kineococcus sp. NUM-3379]
MPERGEGAIMANVNVTYQEMEDAAGRLTAGQQDIEGKLTELKRLVDGLVSGGYVTDTSSKSFQASYDEFTRGATETIRGLEGMSQYLKTAAQTFRETDATLASRLGR